MSIVKTATFSLLSSLYSENPIVLMPLNLAKVVFLEEKMDSLGFLHLLKKYEPGIYRSYPS